MLYYRAMTQAESRLWTAVLLQVEQDLSGEPRANSERWLLQRQAAAWLNSSDTDVGSFTWVCDHLGYDHGEARNKILRHASGVSPGDIASAPT